MTELQTITDWKYGKIVFTNKICKNCKYQTVDNVQWHNAVIFVKKENDHICFNCGYWQNSGSFSISRGEQNIMAPKIINLPEHEGKIN